EGYSDLREHTLVRLHLQVELRGRRTRSWVEPDVVRGVLAVERRGLLAERRWAWNVTHHARRERARNQARWPAFLLHELEERMGDFVPRRGLPRVVDGYLSPHPR